MKLNLEPMEKVFLKTIRRFFFLKPSNFEASGPPPLHFDVKQITIFFASCSIWKIRLVFDIKTVCNPSEFFLYLQKGRAGGIFSLTRSCSNATLIMMGVERVLSYYRLTCYKFWCPVIGLCRWQLFTLSLLGKGLSLFSVVWPEINTMIFEQETTLWSLWGVVVNFTGVLRFTHHTFILIWLPSFRKWFT